MAKIFLDTNYLIDAVERHPKKLILKSLVGHISFISPLSILIYCYLYKIKIPNKQFSLQLGKFQTVDLTQEVSEKALLGPTQDYEDNIQLHSAVESNCDIFLTNDKKILKLKFFGAVKLLASL